MRRPVLITVAAAALLAFVPASTSFAAPNHNQATGTGTLGQFGDPTAHVNAIQTKRGLTGSFVITYPDGTSASGNPTCLWVHGNTAYVVGLIVQASGPRQAANSWYPGGYLVIGVQQNGEPGTAGPDRLNFSAGLPTEPSCGPNGAAVPAYAVVDGNYQVFGQ